MAIKIMAFRDRRFDVKHKRLRGAIPRGFKATRVAERACIFAGNVIASSRYTLYLHLRAIYLYRRRIRARYAATRTAIVDG